MTAEYKTVRTWPDGYTLRCERYQYIGGFSSCHLLYDPSGEPVPDAEVYLWPETRLIWWKHSSYAKARHVAIAWLIVLVAFNTTNFLVDPPGWTAWIPTPISLVVGWMTGRALFNFYTQRRDARGRNRGTEEDHQDPQAQRTTARITFNLALGAGQGTGEDTGLTLDTLSEDMPILAHRYARILPHSGGLSFASMNPDSGLYTTSNYPRFGKDADAFCTRSKTLRLFASTSSVSGAFHGAPAADCTCGFYAVPADQLGTWSDAYGGVSLLVELSGTVIEHELGYRAEHQRVLEWTPPQCPNCGTQAVKAWRAGGELLWDCGDHEMLPPNDTKAPIFALTLDQIAAALEVPHS